MAPLSKYIKCVILAVVLFLGMGSVNAQQSGKQFKNLKQVDLVVLNTKTLKYHELGCSSAIKCTKNCMQISRAEAIRRGQCVVRDAQNAVKVSQL